MNSTAIFWPMVAHVALVFGVYWLLSARRIEAVKAGRAKPSQFRENRDEPAESLFVRNNLENQFQLPMLFYPLCIGLYLIGGANWIAIALAWLFVVLRYAHAWVHVTTNRIRYRRPLFIAGFLVLGALWIWFAVRLAQIGG